jgi:GalNAc-alpha-(1->4)-GalNAc-alpha-(1->3)-diNAcBac-PP-undecaprenol alpha-1,4-N-acetyl-D-galactosaminyltransferase
MLKKILLFYPSFENGGATKNLVRIVNYLLKKKITVILLSHNAKKNEFKFTKDLQIINNKPLKKFSLLPIRWNLALSSMINLFYYAKSNFNNSIIFSMQSHIPAIIISKIIKKKIIIRNSEEPIGATIYADNKFLAIMVLVLKFIFYNFADKIIAISNKSEKSLKKIVFFNNKIVLILNPYVEKILKIKRIKKTKNKKFIILSTGRFTHQKNFFALIDAFTNLSKKYNKIELNIIGKGNQEKLMIKKTQYIRNIKIISWKKNIGNHFLKSDLFILNSFYEGLPNALIDAVNYEIPCISTDVSGARDILINGKGGYIVPINNQHKLEKKIKYVMENYPEAKRKARYAKSRIKRFGKINLLFFYKTFLKLVNYKK